MEQGKCGVEHAILPESGIVVAGDASHCAYSHTCLGAIGAFSTGVGTTDIATVWRLDSYGSRYLQPLNLYLHSKLPKICIW